LEDLVKKEFSKRNCLRVIDPKPDLSKHYPPIVQQLKLYYYKRVHEITELESKKIAKELKDVEGFIDVEQKEKEILNDRLGKIVREDQHLLDVAKAFAMLADEKGYEINEIEIPPANTATGAKEEERGIQPSVSEDEMKNYLEEVLNEIKVRKA
jgi:hypothetical protein